MRYLLLLVPTLLLGGCWNLAVGPALPKPNVMLAPDKAPASLELDPAIQDTFTIPGNGSVNAVPVRGWRGTLTAGFKSAFPTGSPKNLKLEILQADLSFGPAAAGWGGTAAVRASIRYKARLLDASGHQLGALAGTATARDANTSTTEEGMTLDAKEAVEDMYEQLTAKLLSH